MKLLLSWILDHIGLHKKDVDISSLVKQLIDTTAEVDGVESLSLDQTLWYAVSVIDISLDYTVVTCPELQREFSLSARKDAAVGDMFLMILDNQPRWATLVDSGSTKDGLMPPLFMSSEALAGLWRNTFEPEDTVIIIDNKAITNRPDLWGHRGFAREVAALLEVPLKDEESFLKKIEVLKSEGLSLSSVSSFELERTSYKEHEELPCRALAGVFVSQVQYRPSSLWMALRLARVDVRPLSLLVDATNYVMFDIGQPMHAFDADTLHQKKLIGRFATQGETLALLDGTEVSLHESDYVIADDRKVLSLAGIMGGEASKVQSSTRSLILESGNFHPSMVRRTATSLKKRTESATRFEKNLDPFQAVKAVRRYLALMDNEKLGYTVAGPVLALEDSIPKKTIEVTHNDIERKIGIEVPRERVTQILESIGFGVTSTTDSSASYIVSVPSWRAMKDISIQEDIIEEIARFVGFDAIVPQYPQREMIAFDTRKIERTRMIKKFFAFAFSMNEVQTYAFFDEEFLRSISYDPQDTLKIANPLSEHWQRLVTSLIPNLLRCVRDNHFEQESLRFFEINRVWFFDEGAREEQECVGIWYEKKKPLDFYEGKHLLTELFTMLNISIEWRKPKGELEPWYHSSQTAHLWYEDRLIGTAGKADGSFLRTIAEGEAFLFELDANFLLHVATQPPVYTPSPKYPSTDFDISILIGVEHTVSSLEKRIKDADQFISSVVLIDRYEKPEWSGKKSLTFRCTAYDPEGTLTKESIDKIWSSAIKQIQQMGGVLR
ncbi:phenylalanine--tRNA ligase subunit beta [Candidatus Dependentiae bacterium]|nr:phenylalanine--tRNA ligase subunit beta [Candidatus Dependentiae bacterium]